MPPISLNEKSAADAALSNKSGGILVPKMKILVRGIQMIITRRFSFLEVTLLKKFDSIKIRMLFIN